MRIPGTDTSVRLYGFAKANLTGDLDSRVRADTTVPMSTPLARSPANRQGGDVGFTGRRSRIGLETLTPTDLGPLRTQIEMDFAGTQPAANSIATSNPYTPRLRQAWASLGGDIFQVLVGQANSVWNEGLIETLNDATNLNQSFVRQAQIRVTGRLAPGLTGQLSLESPITDYASAAGVFYPDSTLNGGASPAFNRAPDLLGRLTYRGDLGEVGLRGLLRQLEVNTRGTAVATTSSGDANAVGWGTALHGNLALYNVLSPAFGADRLLGMVYYGEGIGRYMDGSFAGQSAVTDLGLRGVGRDFGLDTVNSWGFMAGYRHFWSDKFRTNVSYAYARADYPGYTNGFTPGSDAALARIRDQQQIIANLIWSPFGRVNGAAFSPGAVDVGVEYIFNRRDVAGGASMTGAAGLGHGINSRIQATAIARF
nr:porin [Roseomonas acroporae]